MPVTNPSVVLTMSLCLIPAFEGLAGLPALQRSLLFPFSDVAEGHWWGGAGPLQDRGRFSLRLPCSPFFSSALIVEQVDWRVGGEYRVAALQSRGSVFTEESKQLDFCSFYSELINSLPSWPEICLLSANARHTLYWSCHMGH